MQLPPLVSGVVPVAQWQPGPHGPGPHGPGPHGPHWGSGTGMGTPAFGLGADWLLLVVLVVFLVTLAVLYLAIRANGIGGDDEDGPMTVLYRRYAAGDIDEEEFERRRERLTGRTD